MLADYSGKLLPLVLGGTVLAAIALRPSPSWICWPIGAAVGFALFLVQLLDARLGYPLLRASMATSPGVRIFVGVSWMIAGVVGGAVLATHPSPQDFIPVACGFAASLTALFASYWIWLRFIVNL